jgi:hypothetical protein
MADQPGGRTALRWGFSQPPIGSLLVRSVLPLAVVADRTDGSEARHEAGAKESQIRAATTAKHHRSAEGALRSP